jgi:hypothetical protein
MTMTMGKKIKKPNIKLTFIVQKKSYTNTYSHCMSIWLYKRKEEEEDEDERMVCRTDPTSCYLPILISI